MEASQARQQHTTSMAPFSSHMPPIRVFGYFLFSPLLPVLKMNDVFCFSVSFAWPFLLLLLLLVLAACVLIIVRATPKIFHQQRRGRIVHRCVAPKLCAAQTARLQFRALRCDASVVSIHYTYITHISITPHGTHKYLLWECAVFGRHCRLVNDVGHCNCRGLCALRSIRELGRAWSHSLGATGATPTQLHYSQAKAAAEMLKNVVTNFYFIQTFAFAVFFPPWTSSSPPLC